MNELTQEEFDCSASDKADLEIIQHYLEVGDDETFFNRAAAAYPKTGASDPDKFLGDVEDLHLHSVGAASRHRNKLLLRMNQQTLRGLAARVLDHELLFKYVFISGRKDSLKSIEQDPVSGPVLAMIRKRGLLPKPKDLVIEEKLEAASELAYPKLPCDLETALKWATGEPDIRFEILERAFFDWTTTVAETSGIRESTLKRHRSSFKPGARHHAKIADQTKKLIELILGTPPKVKAESHLILFGTEFRLFWEKHAAAYKRRARERSSINRELAPGGPISNMRPVWIARTEAFVRYIQGRDFPLSGTDEWDMFFNKFAESQPHERRTKLKISGFIRTLCAHSSQPLTQERIITLIDLLKSEKISAVDEETIRSCMKILSSAMVH